MSGDIFLSRYWERRCHCIKWAQARDVAKHLHNAQDKPHNKELSHPKLSIALMLRNPGLYKWKQAIT